VSQTSYCTGVLWALIPEVTLLSLQPRVNTCFAKRILQRSCVPSCSSCGVLHNKQHVLLNWGSALMYDTSTLQAILCHHSHCHPDTLEIRQFGSKTNCIATVARHLLEIECFIKQTMKAAHHTFCSALATAASQDGWLNMPTAMPYA